MHELVAGSGVAKTENNAGETLAKVTEEVTVPTKEQALITDAYEVIREYLTRSGVDLSPANRRIAFYDDDTRHTNKNLGGTRENHSETVRAGFVQVWQVGGKYNIQIHIYLKDHPDVTPLNKLYELATEYLPEKYRDFPKDCIGRKMSAEMFMDFVDRIRGANLLPEAVTH